MHSALTDFVYLFDLRGRFIYVNAALLNLWGLRLEDAVGKNFSELHYPAELAAKLQAQIEEVVQTRKTVCDQTPYTSPSGKAGYYEYIFNPVLAPDGTVEAVAGCTRDITTRTNEESAQRLFAALVESSDDAIISKDLTGIITSWNQGAQVLFGYTAEEVIGGPLSVIYPPDRADEMPSILARIERGEKVRHFETVRMAKGGRLVEVSVTVSPLRTASGRIIGASKIVRDISDRKRIERTLRENAEQLRLIADTAPVYIAQCDRDHRYVFVNTPYAARFGMRPEQLIGRRIEELIGPEAYAEIREHLDRALAGEAVEFEAALPYANVGTHFMRCAYAPERDASGAIVGAVAALLDISERKRTEQALAARTQELTTLLEMLPAFVWTTSDPECRVITGNRAANALTGTAPGTNISQTAVAFGEGVYLRQFKEDGSEYRPEELPMQRALATGQPVTDAFLDFCFSDGRRVQAMGNSVPLFDENGRVRGGVSAFLDITERKRDEAALIEATRAAEAANESKDRFLAVLSHELRTPLTPVLLVTEEFANDSSLRPDVHEALAMIRRNVQLEVKLIDDLLDLSRITSGKVALRSEAVDLNDAVRHVCEICRPQFLEKAVHVQVDLNKEPTFVSADPARLRQVLWNVVKNAVKFTPKHGTIRITTAVQGDGLSEVRVSDSGIGIPPEILPRIFNAFEQGDVLITRQFGGLGLGLAISRALVEMQGGSIRAESAGANQGAAFSIALPSRSPQPAPSAPLAPPDPVATIEKIRLLIVEDHADTSLALSRLLRSAGFATITASNVAHAVATAEREHFDVLISDLGLPDGDGFEIIRRIHTIRKVPGIAMSGYGMEEDMRRSQEAGFAEHLIKPIDIAMLIEAIRRVSATAPKA